MNLSPDIVLKTKRCKLRIIKREDIPFVFSATKEAGFHDGMLWDASDTQAGLIELAKAILELGFETLSVLKVEAYYALRNVKSEKVLTTVGMKFIERISQGFEKKGNG